MSQGRVESVALYDPDDVCGRLVGAAPRDRVRGQNLPHAATAVFVRRRDGRLLVHRRARDKDLWPGLLDCAAGGVVQAGETPDDAAHRELAEELGVHGATLRPLLTTWYRDPDTHYLAHVYETVWDGPVMCADGEVDQVWWQPQTEVFARALDPREPFVPDTRRLVDLLTGDRDPTGVQGQAWPVGASVVWRFGMAGRTRFARMARVLRHDAAGLVLWVGQGWPAVEQALADGRAVREATPVDRLTAPRVRRTAAWRGPGVVVVVPAGGQPWSVWLFFDAHGAFTGWYGNLEAPHRARTTRAGSHLLDTADRALDVVVGPDRVPRWKDEDEFAALAGQPGRWTARDVPTIRADGEALADLARQGAWPFDGSWTTLRPDRAWPVPAFPPDWDLPHVAGP